MTIAERRRENAEHLYEHFDFTYYVVDADGWQDEGDNELRKVVYLQDPDDSSRPTIKGVMHVQFSGPDGVAPVGVHANVRGEVVGEILAGGQLQQYILHADSPSAPRP